MLGGGGVHVRPASYTDSVHHADLGDAEARKSGHIVEDTTEVILPSARIFTTNPLSKLT